MRPPGKPPLVHILLPRVECKLRGGELLDPEPFGVLLPQDVSESEGVEESPADEVEQMPLPALDAVRDDGAVDENEDGEDVCRAEGRQVEEEDHVFSVVDACLGSGLGVGGAHLAVDLLDVRVLDVDEEDHLQDVRKHRGVEHHVRLRHQGDPVVEAVPHRVHRVGEHLEDAIKGQVRLNREEEVPPVPRKVSNDSVRIGLAPQGKERQTRTNNVHQNVEEPKRLGQSEVHNSEHQVRHEVVRKNNVNDDSEDNPCVELMRVLLHLVGDVLVAVLQDHTRLKLLLDPLVLWLRDPIPEPLAEGKPITLVVQHRPDTPVVRKPPYQKGDHEEPVRHNPPHQQTQDDQKEGQDVELCGKRLERLYAAQLVSKACGAGHVEWLRIHKGLRADPRRPPHFVMALALRSFSGVGWVVDRGYRVVCG